MRHVFAIGMIANLCLSTTALAHARLRPNSTLNPRTTSSGEKTSPCGATTPATDATKRTTLAPGQKLVVNWEETINHPGHFRIAFSKDGTTGFDTNVLLDNIADNQNTAVNYSDPNTYHQFSATVTIPTATCETCTIQLIQVMSDQNDKPYFSCADIRISTSAPQPPAPTPTSPAPDNKTSTPEAPTNLRFSTKS